MSKTYDRMERIFRDLDGLLKTGEFEKHEVGFMLEFQEMALNATKNMAKRAGFLQPEEPRNLEISNCKDCPCKFFDLEKYWEETELCGLQTDKEQEQAGGKPILCPAEGVAKECPLRQHHVLLKVKNG